MIKMHNNKDQLPEPALKKVILDCLPVKIIGRMHAINRTGNTDQKTIEIISISKATTEQWEEAWLNLSTKNSQG
jgi:hypothetical protein